MYSLVIALCFLSNSYWTVQLQQLKTVYTDTAILQKGEYIFNDVYYFGRDIEIIEYREKHITPDTPPAEARFHLPSSEACIDAIYYGREFEDYLEAIYPFRNISEQNDIDRILTDLKWRRQVWQLTRSIHFQYADREGVRLEMQRLRDMIGTDNFNKGNWPHPLPDAGRNSIWRSSHPPIMEIP